jgi:hypothetical protein
MKLLISKSDRERYHVFRIGLLCWPLCEVPDIAKMVCAIASIKLAVILLYLPEVK